MRSKASNWNSTTPTFNNQDAQGRRGGRRNPIVPGTPRNDQPDYAAPRNGIHRAFEASAIKAVQEARGDAEDENHRREFPHLFKKVPTTFVLHAPEARSVQLAAEFTEWENQCLEMRFEPSGVWAITVELLPGWYLYRFLVDGKWEDDPNCNFTIPNPFGSRDAVVQVPWPDRDSELDYRRGER